MIATTITDPVIMRLLLDRVVLATTVPKIASANEAYQVIGEALAAAHTDLGSKPRRATERVARARVLRRPAAQVRPVASLKG